MTANQNYFVETWKGDSPPGEGELHRLLGEQGLSGYRWSNSPGDVYGAHSHSFHKIIYVLQGSITFILPEQGEQVTLTIEGTAWNYQAGSCMKLRWALRV